jgi:hypothetical protein
MPGPVVNSESNSLVLRIGLPPISREQCISQYHYMFEMAPYLYLAKAVGEETEFYECFFKVWFKRWPETPQNEDDISCVERYMNTVKKVCVGLTVAVNLKLLLSYRMLLTVMFTFWLVVGRRILLMVIGVWASRLLLTPMLVSILFIWLLVQCSSLTTVLSLKIKRTLAPRLYMCPLMKSWTGT